MDGKKCNMANNQSRQQCKVNQDSQEFWILGQKITDSSSVNSWFSLKGLRNTIQRILDSP